jgi:hypothetical protein
MQTDMTKLVVALGNFANAPEIILTLDDTDLAHSD